MKYAVYAPNFNDYGEPQALVELAVVAEQAGYDAIFLWDHLMFSNEPPLPACDALTTLAAIAQATSRLRMGAMITPVARRRPWKLARELVTLDRLSHGRIHFGVGLGEPAELEFAAFGEQAEAKHRAGRLDEGLEIIMRLCAGEHVDHAGHYYQVDGITFAPAALQQPRIPLWSAATLPAQAGLRRAAKWDGVFPVKLPELINSVEQGEINWRDWWLSVDEFAQMVKAVAALRPDLADFDFVASARLGEDGPAGARPAQFAAVGATWWCEWVDESPGHFEHTLKLVAAGPPRPD